MHCERLTMREATAVTAVVVLLAMLPVLDDVGDESIGSVRIREVDATLLEERILTVLDQVTKTVR